MFIRRARALIVAVLWLWPTSLRAQSEALMDANNRGNALLEAGQYEQAIPFWRKALELGESELGANHLTTAALLDALAQTYLLQGRYTEAEPFFVRALSIREKALGAEHPDVAVSLNNLAELYRAQGRYADAEPLYKRSLAILEKTIGPEHPRSP